MDKNLKKMLMILVMSSVLLSGCGKEKSEGSDKNATSSSSNGNSDAEESMHFPDYYSDEDGIVVFDCDVVAPSDVTLNSCIAKKMDLNGEKIAEGLLDGKTILSTEEFGESTPKMYQYSMENSSLSVTGNRILLMFESFDFVSSAFRLGDEDEGYNGDKFKSNQDFEFATRESAEQEFIEYLYDITGTNDFMINSYTLDYATLNEELQVDQEILDIKGIEVVPFTEEQNGYYFACRQKSQGLPVFVKLASGMVRQENDLNTPISAYYTEDGMILFYFDGEVLYDFEIGSDSLKLLEFDEVATVVSNYYNKMLTDSKFIAYRTTLYNYIRSDGSVTPVWIFKMHENKADGISSCVQLEVDAVTGEVLTQND